MMMICGLKVIISSEVPEILRYGANSVVLTPREAMDVAVDSYAPKPGGPLVRLIEGHSRYLEKACSSASS
jgi:hypothetical protein